MTLTAGAVEARLSLPTGQPERMADIMAALHRARENVRNEMGISSIRFPMRGQPRLELMMGAEVEPEHIDALIARIEQIVGFVMTAEPVRKPDSPLFACSSLSETLLMMHDELSSRSRKYPGPNGERIFHSRIGLVQRFQTLEELGEESVPPVTRERVRQVSSDIIEWMRADPVVGDFLVQLERMLKEMIDERAMHSPPGVVQVGKDCPIACLRVRDDDSGSDASFEVEALGRFLASYLIDDSGEPVFELVELSKGKTAIFQAADPAEVDRLQSELLDLLVQRSRQGELRAGAIVPEIDRILSSAPQAHRQRARVRFLQELNWTDDPWKNAEATLASCGNSIRSVLAAVLARSEDAMSRNDLVRAASDGCWRLTRTPASIGNEIFRLAADPRNRGNEEVFIPVFQLARGRFGTSRHMPIDITGMHEDAELAADLIVNGRATPDPELPYQWHCVDLVDELLERGQCAWLKKVEPARRWSLLDCLLRYHGPERIVNLSKGFWVARQGSLAPEDHAKRNQSDIVERVLAGGERMSSAQLKKAVERYQSLGATRQLQEPAEPFVHRDGEWYLQAR